MERIKGNPIEGIDWEFGPPHLRIGIERDQAGHWVLLFCITRATQFDNWTKTLLIVLRLRRPWLVWFNALVNYD